jgi:hypothetical protein
VNRRSPQADRTPAAVMAQAALPGVRRVLSRGPITLTEVDLFEPGS